MNDRQLLGWLIEYCGQRNCMANVRDAILAAQHEEDASEWWLEQWLRKQPDG